jgi:hypothetical protein
MPLSDNCLSPHGESLTSGVETPHGESDILSVRDMRYLYGSKKTIGELMSNYRVRLCDFHPRMVYGRYTPVVITIVMTLCE